MHIKKTMYTIAILIISALLITGCAPSEVGGEKRDMEGIRIIVDPGHGDTDAGTTGTTTGRLEKDVNLQISLKLEEALASRGVEVIMTRSDDAPLGPADETDIEKRKEADMQRREEIIENADAQLLVSIHQNNFDDQSVKGAQVFYLRNKNDGKDYGVQFAEEIQSALNDGPSAENPRNIGNGNWRLLKKGSQPGCIVECGFFSNEEEEKLLQTDAYQNSLVDAIITGIDNYVKKYGV